MLFEARITELKDDVLYLSVALKDLLSVTRALAESSTSTSMTTTYDDADIESIMEAAELALESVKRSD